jgi:hypothetical protein
LDQQVAGHFADIVAVAQATLSQVAYEIDATPQRAILRLQARYGRYQVLITELFTDGVRKYRYYVLQANWVEAGFDNSPDPRALRLKYGRIGSEHAGELIPHLHRENKTQLLLTAEITVAAFIEWLQTNLPVEMDG